MFSWGSKGNNGKKRVKKAYNLKDYFRRHDEKLTLTRFRAF